ncbi:MULTISPECIES: adenosylmethionine--8-amino-7-oxononanoate transaminase [Psychrobacter]|uniref:Adenosylmethionine-8-amino-7-oxononanoate aminotransferase n=1 Tax=Psychrobacter alimentarius TaxID=261164 RepID=A0ABN4MZ24_9GAMM|nr:MULTISPECIES: adenosylmethionine--8-amino-7-oxononanoate transaminase [Psychrobacter]AMT96045.1 Adenosylmethionine-8-amino-7-oxononanoate aminotransferase [Psychrobacter alimentarius]QCB31541.1 adenosylmethionine--8-amino-7-oxononanoate transaminase [Psychrobacter sp. PAMC27889]
MTTDVFQSTSDFDQKHLWHPYASLPPTYRNIVIDHADGIYIVTQDGTRLIDGMSSWWASVHGYNHPALNEAIVQQLGKMAHVMFGGLTHQPAIDLGKKLLDIVPAGLDAIFYADSGSIAVEVALKMALQYQVAAKRPTKQQFASTHSGYYGDTWHAMSVCDPVNGMHSLYGKQLPMQHFVPAPPLGFERALTTEDRTALSQFFVEHGAQLAGFIIEPIIQGAGGMRFYSPEYLQLLRELCDEHDVLLIADEIATGFGRSGKLFACEHADITPDIMTLGKALTGGYMTFAATLCTRKVADTIHHSDYPALMHGPTFMGNPLACTVACASIDLILSYDIEARTANMQAIMEQQLSPAEQLAGVAEVRCLGAVAVIELHEAVDMPIFQSLLIEHDIWVRPFGKLVYIMPPYIITDEELITLCQALLKVVRTYLENRGQP